MRRTFGYRARSTISLCALMAAACVDSPSAAADPQSATADDPLAQTFDALAATASASGDLARKEGFEMAALSVRAGVNPSSFQLAIASNEVETMDAFVSAAEFSTSIAAVSRPPARRTMVAWRRSNNGALRVVSVLAPFDSATVLSPLSLGLSMNSRAVYAGASAQYLDLAPTAATSSAVSSSWYASSGYVKIRQLRTRGGCEKLRSSTRIGGVTCEEAEYAVSFSTSMQRMTGQPPQLVAATPILVRTEREQTVNGERFVFSCPTPTSSSGCR